MKNDKLTQLWNSQGNNAEMANPDHIIKKAQKQRVSQYTSIAIMSTTVLVLILYAVFYVGNQWNQFVLGLVLMVVSLIFRIVLEFVSLYRKESRLVVLDHRAFRKYLKRYYKARRWINYLITPLCFASYIYGFLQLLPYFKQMFSNAFFIYILFSGAVSLFVIAWIIVKSMVKEQRFFAVLNNI